MRLFLIPISTGRTLIYCKKLDAAVPAKQLSYLDRITNKATATWAKWETAEKGWQKTLVTYGHRALQRIPYEEWGLKSVPPLSSRRETAERQARKPVELLYPKNAIKSSKVMGLLHQLATERQQLHRKRMWWSIVVAPLTAPFALVPVIPNIPFFFFCYRGWSHWRALGGSKHLEFLLKENLIRPRSLTDLENVYLRHYPRKDGAEDTIADEKTAPDCGDGNCGEEVMLLKDTDGKALAKMLDAPELVAEVERAVHQVQQQLDQKKKQP
ncbi:hypothetical protein GTR04_5667 [Trichophyton interdigitale]|uniref:Uncharacterized protein n=1 Tax=Trichophyton interdigitale (strain MR816) TaxID=1215338 RepID=A0A059JBF8_TRIIM|nr:hypothetical protein H101_02405 [Trichophyton interdigitale H6]KAG5209716.1 hypothetical protein GY631_5520 [Trichophyton interdigitale]KAG5217746.1 hypothetical protein GY632_6243 [Trichophyton interdigitale]KAG8206949.1 hypothetical protein GTR04_5667 [Trichophyton interdigitale]KDB25196.1 hypothetical protein H109_02967 [Trichophyton interdigitale MR816]